MTAATYDFTVEQGATLSKMFAWQNPDGTPVDLTGYSARGSLRTDYASRGGTEVLSLDSRLSINAGAGEVTLTISASDTAALTLPTMLYQIELVSAGGVVTRLVQGNIVLSPEVDV